MNNSSKGNSARFIWVMRTEKRQKDISSHVAVNPRERAQPNSLIIINDPIKAIRWKEIPNMVSRSDIIELSKIELAPRYLIADDFHLIWWSQIFLISPQRYWIAKVAIAKFDIPVKIKFIDMSWAIADFSRFLPFGWHIKRIFECV